MDKSTPASPSEQSTLLQQVENWALKEGFPLEMRLRREFALAGFDLAQPAYLDEDTNTYRAGGDVVAHKSCVRPAAFGGEFRAYAFAVVECKLGASKPWVIFTQPHEGAGITLVQQMTSVPEDRSTVEQMVLVFRDALENSLHRDGPLFAPSNVGYAVSEFQGNPGRSPPFDAIRQVLSGAIGATREHKKYFGDPVQRSTTAFAAVNFIVTEAPLFTCGLDSVGRAKIEETNDVVYVDFRGQGQTQRMHYVRIARVNRMRELLPLLGDDLSVVANCLVEVLERKSTTQNRRRGRTIRGSLQQS